MRIIGQEELDVILEAHGQWIVSHRREGEKANLADTHIIDCKVSNRVLDAADFTRASIIDCSFSDCDFSRCNLSQSEWIGVSFEDCRFILARITNATVRADLMTRCHFFAATFENSDLCISEGEDVVLDRAKLNNTQLRYTGESFNDVSMRRAVLVRSDLSRITFRNSDFTQSIFTATQIGDTTFDECNFSHADLSEADGNDVSFLRSNLRSANLSGVELNRFDLSGAQLVGCDLSNSSVRSATLEGVNFAGAKLHGIDFSILDDDSRKAFCSSLTGSDLAGSNLRGIGTVSLTRWLVSFVLPSWAITARSVPFRTDDTGTRDVMFDHDVMDEWSILRRTYTGSRFGILIVLTALAFAPLAAELAFLSMASQAQERATKTSLAVARQVFENLSTVGGEELNEFRQWTSSARERVQRAQERQLTDKDSFELSLLLVELPTQIDSAHRLVREYRNRTHDALKRVDSTLEMADEKAEEIEFLQNDLRRRNDALKRLETNRDWLAQGSGTLRLILQSEVQLRRVTVWQQLIQLPQGAWAMAFAVTLLIYNALRGTATILIAGLRESEDRSGFSPKRSVYWKYWALHCLLTPIKTIAFIAAVGHLWTTLNAELLVPS